MPPDSTHQSKPHQRPKLQELFYSLRNEFKQAGIKTSELDARLLIQAATGLDHASVILHSERLLSDPEIQTLKTMAQRRLQFEPVSRILEQREFYGTNFTINDNVLDPRADTETLIDVALSTIQADQNLDILDIGTGTGAIIITLLRQLPNAKGLATDISPEALKVAKLNSKNLGVDDRLTFRQTSWCEDIDQQFDLIVSNPPYIPTTVIDQLSKDVKNYDPHLALDGGNDGLQAYRKIASLAPARLKPKSTIALEIGHDQAKTVVDIFTARGFIAHPKIKTITRDLGDNDRIITLFWS